MTINEYVKKWCEEDYDVRKEDFYVENAFYIASREWASGGLKHGLVALILSFTFLGGMELLGSFVTLGALTVCFWLYGIREYDANSSDTSIVLYVMTLIALLILKKMTPQIVHMLFAIPTNILYIYLTFVKPIKFHALKTKMKNRILQEEKEAERSAKQAYDRWEAGYKAFRYGLPDGEVNSGDPIRMEAEALFDGYCGDKNTVKSRYRQLIKIHHPDRGGDEKLCQHIIAVYEELMQKFA